VIDDRPGNTHKVTGEYYRKRRVATTSRRQRWKRCDENGEFIGSLAAHMPKMKKPQVSDLG